MARKQNTPVTEATHHANGRKKRTARTKREQVIDAGYRSLRKAGKFFQVAAMSPTEDTRAFLEHSMAVIEYIDTHSEEKASGNVDEFGLPLE